ncbi:MULTISPECIES: cyclophilin-like fold protein [Paenibacillus]|uniref:cyclophilin-like fold protein n=1 Tax=Paenibacillus TaxID=44249 RepID=UPI00300BBEF1
MKIKLAVGNDEYKAVLNDSPAAADFLAMLPMTLTLKDYADMEKISDLRLTVFGFWECLFVSFPGKGTGYCLNEISFNNLHMYQGIGRIVAIAPYSGGYKVN